MSKKTVFTGITCVVLGTTALLAFNLNQLANPVMSIDAMTNINITASTLTAVGVLTIIGGAMFYDSSRCC